MMLKEQQAFVKAKNKEDAIKRFRITYMTLYRKYLAIKKIRWNRNYGIDKFGRKEYQIIYNVHYKF